MNEEFFKKLTEAQAQYALEIAEKAEQMGIDPKLAVAVAYQESRFRPEAIGTSGEIGLMQVMPKTAKGMGFSIEDLRNPSKNIEIGLTYLKRGLDKFDGDPVLAVAGYNAGLDHPYFKDPDNKSLPSSTEKYISDINSFGGFTPTPAPQEQEEGEPTPVVEPASEDDFMKNKSRIAADALAAGSGALIGKGLDVGKNIGATAQAMRQLPSALSAAQGVPGMAAAAPSAAPMQGMPRPVAGGPAGPVGGPVSPLQQMGGSAGYNYGKAFGLTDIEAGRATDMSKAPGGASDLIAKRTESLQKIGQMYPGGQFAENPRYGGIMTPQQTAGGGPRASFVQSPGGMTQIPAPQPVPVAPPPAPPRPSPLSQVAGMAKQGAGAVLGSPITMGALGGLSAMESGSQAQDRYAAGDMPGAAIAGAGVLGGGMQMLPHPASKGIGAMISAASPLTLYLYDKLRGQQETPEPSPQEMRMARQPAFRYARP